MKPLPKIICRGIRADHKGKPFNPEQSYWVEGDVSYHQDGRVFIRNWDMGTYKAFQIVPSTLGVFTGFIDINKRRIFTGDLVKIALDLGYGKFIIAESYVYFDGGCFCVNWGDQSRVFQGDDRFRSRMDGFNPNNTTFEVIADVSSVVRNPIILTNKEESQ